MSNQCWISTWHCWEDLLVWRLQCDAHLNCSCWRTWVETSWWEAPHRGKVGFSRGGDDYMLRSSHQRCSVRKGVLRNLPKIHRKTPVPDSCAIFLKKRLKYGCFPVNFVKFLITPFIQNTSGRLLLHVENNLLYFTLSFFYKCSLHLLEW